MNQRVKLQVNSELTDVPRLSGVMLQEAIIYAANLKQLLEETSNHLKHTELDGEESLENFLRQLENMDSMRHLLMKIDSRVGDVASIISGLHEVLTKPSQDSEQQKADHHDNVTSG